MSHFPMYGLSRRGRYIAARARNAAVNLLSTGNIRGVRSQHCADFSNYVDRLGGRQDSGFPDKWRIDPQFDISDPCRVAVVIHCFYADLLEELIGHLTTIPVPFDLFITNASGQELGIPSDLTHLRHCLVVEVENHGRDIFPTLQLINSGILDPYELILKLHTKKSPWREEHTELAGSGSAWKDQFLNDLVGSRESVTSILNAFAADASLGVLTATDSIVGSEFWGGDKRIVEQLARRIELESSFDDLEFASGSMYWCRGFILQGLRSLNLQAADFDDEAGQVDGTTAHAIERLIGILTKEAGLRTKEPSWIYALESEGINKNGYERFIPGSSIRPNATVIPFYLPQFHESSQNNRWWGKGFTEWTNVAGAVPAYRGHYQPKQPSDLGYYDLELDSVRQAQAELASSHGIAGFMYYYYWFSGQRILNLPIEKLHDSTVDFPFCIMWANENWTRRWDGRSHDVLIGQDYSKIPAEDFIDDVLEFLADPRYMRLEGKPILAVYRPAQMENFAEVVQTWRERARNAGVGELHILAVAVAQDFDGIGEDFTSLGLDGTLEFPPHNLPWVAGPATKVGLDSRWRGNFMSYSATAEASMRAASRLKETQYPGAMVGFDNTARRQWKADSWYGSNPYTFHRWLAGLVRAVAPREEKDRVIFINAWNEWAESAILEPTTRFGRTFLLALRNAICS